MPLQIKKDVYFALKHNSAFIVFKGAETCSTFKHNRNIIILNGKIQIFL
jgi:hypothetical protein